VLAAIRFLCDTPSITGHTVTVDNGAHLVPDIEAPTCGRQATGSAHEE
jgi:hypothetical protein